MVSFNSCSKLVDLGLILVVLSLGFTETKSLAAAASSSSVSVGYEQLNETSSSILMAESWVRTHVLAHYPSLQITSINVGEGVLCSINGSEDKWNLVLPSMKNIYHSLVRWGLQKDIKVSTSLSIECYREDLVDSVIKPVFKFLQETNSSLEGITKLGVSQIRTARPKSRKLSSNGERASPPVSSPLAQMTPPSPVFSFPFSPQSSAFPPLPESQQPPSMSFSFAPQSPSEVPYPPCYAPTPTPTPTPSRGEGEGGKGLWCVAKPSVPEEKLQEALDYACGAGGADCEEIGVHGSCYYPDTVMAHASYAFNSYWQKNKKNGGSCSFGGTAMVINANPSFEHCSFILS